AGMTFQDLPIRQKVVSVIMLTSMSALVVMAAAFMIYDALNYRRTLEQHLRTTAAIIGETTTAYLAFPSEKEPQQALIPLRADAQVTPPPPYTEAGHLLLRYPQTASTASFPLHPGRSGLSRKGNDLGFFE